MNDKSPCFECQDGYYKPVRQTYVSQLSDGSFLTVPDIDILTCIECGDECLDSETSKKIDKARYKHNRKNK
jgi:hypothetical protein